MARCVSDTIQPPTTTTVTEIVGGSVASLVFIIVIMIVTVWCWRKGKCDCCKKNSTMIEKNEMYGPPADYYQYAKDAYDTKIVDDNYMYDNS